MSCQYFLLRLAVSLNVPVLKLVECAVLICCSSFFYHSVYFCLMYIIWSKVAQND